MSYPLPQNARKERIKDMKIRSDSAFAKLTDEQKDFLLDMADGMNLDELADRVEIEFGIETTSSSVQRYLARLRREVMIEEAKAAEEGMSQLAELGKKATSREATLEVARQKLLDVASTATSGENAKLMEVMKMLGEEKAREHELAMRERAMKVAEENAKLGWRKLELQQARSALRLLPAILQVVTGGEGTAEERLGKVRELLMSGGGQLLFSEKTG
jgi:hypothetical protein